MSRNILLLVTGMTPQIVTETVYGLAINPDNCAAWIPDEIHVISTQDGLNQIRDRLFEKGNFQRLIDDYQLPPIDFDESNLHCIEQNGERLKDLKTPDDNEQAADTICALVRRFTADDHTRLHVSIAGGRKTMGFYAGYALSLYGRAQDSMSHVLVEDRFETVSDFYYPTPETRFVTNREGKTLDAKEAQVWLADIPFVRLRSSLTQDKLISQSSFSDVVHALNMANQPLTLTLNTKQQSVKVGDQELVLAAREFAFYWWFAHQKQQGLGSIEAPHKNMFAVQENAKKYPILTELSQKFLHFYEQLRGDLDAETVQQTLEYGMERSFFDGRKTNLATKLKNKFGAEMLKKIGISNTGRGSGQYELLLAPSQIVIIQD